jgi:hypothetical protein
MPSMNSRSLDGRYSGESLGRMLLELSKCPGGCSTSWNIIAYSVTSKKRLCQYSFPKQSPTTGNNTIYTRKTEFGLDPVPILGYQYPVNEFAGIFDS